MMSGIGGGEKGKPRAQPSYPAHIVGEEKHLIFLLSSIQPQCTFVRLPALSLSHMIVPPQTRALSRSTGTRNNKTLFVFQGLVRKAKAR